MSDPSNNTFDKVLSIVQKQYKIDTSSFTPATTIAESGLDSLAFADLLFEIEDVFEIKLDDVAPELLPKDLGGVIEMIETAIAAKSTAASS